MNDVQRERLFLPHRLQWVFKLKLWRTLDQRWFCWHQERTDKEDLCEGVKHILSKVI
jgi:hypothetical protein